MSGLIGLLHRHDERALHFLVTRRYRGLDWVMRLITHLADPLPAIAIALLLSASSEFGVYGRRGLFALVISHMLVQVLKRTCCRARPILPVGITSLIHAPDHFSFPSGHSAAGMAVALPLMAVLPWPGALAAGALAALVGVSRSYLGVHYPGDVLAGWLLANVAYLLGGWLLV